LVDRVVEKAVVDKLCVEKAGVEKLCVEKAGVEKAVFGVEKAVVEKVAGYSYYRPSAVLAPVVRTVLMAVQMVAAIGNRRAVFSFRSVFAEHSLL
jgi:hypothetical protein